MNAWIFTHPDTWLPTEAPDWGDNEDVDAFMTRLGYRFEREAPNSDLVEFLGAWRLYAARQADVPYKQGLLVDGGGGDCVLVWLPTFPDLLAYLARYGEIGQSGWMQVTLDELQAMGAKLFRAWHGHEAQSCCPHCDPHAYNLWQQRQAERKARQAQGVT